MLWPLESPMAVFCRRRVCVNTYESGCPSASQSPFILIYLEIVLSIQKYRNKANSSLNTGNSRGALV